MTADQSTLTGAGARALVVRMEEAANDFLASLASDQRARATFSFEDEGERTRWFYTPVSMTWEALLLTHWHLVLHSSRHRKGAPPF